MNAKQDIDSALRGKATTRREAHGEYPRNRKRRNILLTLPPNVIDNAKNAARESGFGSMSRYVEALLTLDGRSRQKSPTAYGIAPITRIGEAAAGALFALQDASRAGRPVDSDLTAIVAEIRDACAALLRAAMPAYEADLDRVFRFKNQDRWGDD